MADRLKPGPFLQWLIYAGSQYAPPGVSNIKVVEFFETYQDAIDFKYKNLGKYFWWVGPVRQAPKDTKWWLDHNRSEWYLLKPGVYKPKAPPKFPPGSVGGFQEKAGYDP